jgi:hypothetical protein
MNSKLTKLAFLLGSIYFVFMALAHFFSVKVPILFIYYNTPFYAYQDKIISFAVTAYIALFYGASQSRDVARYAILVMIITAAGLSYINISSELNALLTEQQTTMPYWIQTGMIGAYTLVLIALYLNDRNN